MINNQVDNTLFHYTSLSTFMLHILPKKELKLSKIKDSRDPYEYQAFNVRPKVDETLQKDMKFEDFLNEAKTLKLNSQYLCLCMPDCKNDKDNHARMGYDRPKVWESYGDDHRGVCIALNKDKLLSEFKLKKPRILRGQSKYGEIVYKDIVRMLDDPKSKSLENYYLEHNSFDKIDFLRVFEKAFFFQKDFDYKDENEYRLVYIPTGNYNEMEKKDLKLDISNIITALYFGDRVEKEFIEFYKKIVEKEFPTSKLYQVQWFNGAVELRHV